MTLLYIYLIGCLFVFLLGCFQLAMTVKQNGLAVWELMAILVYMVAVSFTSWIGFVMIVLIDDALCDYLLKNRLVRGVVSIFANFLGWVGRIMNFKIVKK